MYIEIKNEAGTLIGLRWQLGDIDMLIPVDLTNREYQGYLRWLSDGNTPKPPIPSNVKMPVWDDTNQKWEENPSYVSARSVRNAARARLRSDRANGGPTGPRQIWSVLEDIMAVNPGLLVDE